MAKTTKAVAVAAGIGARSLGAISLNIGQTYCYEAASYADPISAPAIGRIITSLKKQDRR